MGGRRPPFALIERARELSALAAAFSATLSGTPVNLNMRPSSPLPVRSVPAARPGAHLSERGPRKKQPPRLGLPGPGTASVDLPSAVAAASHWDGRLPRAPLLVRRAPMAERGHGRTWSRANGSVSAVFLDGAQSCVELPPALPANDGARSASPPRVQPTAEAGTDTELPPRPTRRQARPTPSQLEFRPRVHASDRHDAFTCTWSAQLLRSVEPLPQLAQAARADDAQAGRRRGDALLASVGASRIELQSLAAMLAGKFAGGVSFAPQVAVSDWVRVYLADRHAFASVERCVRRTLGSSRRPSRA